MCIRDRFFAGKPALGGFDNRKEGILYSGKEEEIRKFTRELLSLIHILLPAALSTRYSHVFSFIPASLTGRNKRYYFIIIHLVPAVFKMCDFRQKLPECATAQINLRI